MKIHDGGMQGGHRFASRNPHRRQCLVCKATYNGAKPLCRYCENERVIRLPVRRDEDEGPPPQAA